MILQKGGGESRRFYSMASSFARLVRSAHPTRGASFGRKILSIPRVCSPGCSGPTSFGAFHDLGQDGSVVASTSSCNAATFKCIVPSPFRPEVNNGANTLHSFKSTGQPTPFSCRNRIELPPTSQGTVTLLCNEVPVAFCTKRLHSNFLLPISVEPQQSSPQQQLKATLHVPGSALEAKVEIPNQQGVRSQLLKTKKLTKTAKHIMEILDREAVESVRKGREIPDLQPGDIVQLRVEVPENKRRVSLLKGIVIARRNCGLNTTFRIRRVLAGVGVEMVFPLYSPNIKEIKVLEKRRVRRAKLFYLRQKIARMSSV